jgi:hypothetical protein
LGDACETRAASLDESAAFGELELVRDREYVPVDVTFGELGVGDAVDVDPAEDDFVAAPGA